MDLLLSLGMEADDLPEQQTRTVDLMHQYAGREQDFNFNLGFDACCTCGKEIKSNDKNTIIKCPNCRRVNYCSESCRHQDSNVPLPAASTNGGDEEGQHEQDNAMGHSSVICALLNLCAESEAVEEVNSKKAESGTNNKSIEAAQDRVRSELESYPATLSNVIMEGPCYQDIFKSISNKTNSGSCCLVLHIIGASADSEFWNYNNESDDDHGEAASVSATCLNAYAEALADLADTNNIDTIELVFIGPECPKRNIEVSKTMNSSSSSSQKPDIDRIGGGSKLLIRSYRGLYEDIIQDSSLSLSKPDIVVFFNPGFTVPEYDWRKTLASIYKGTPFLSTTNTELEGIADCQYLLDQDKIQTLPPGLADIFGLYSGGGGDGEGEGGSDDNTPGSSTTTTAFFNMNPFCGSRVRQSGTMANDVYVKNRWILGGIMDSFDPSKSEKKKDAPPKRQRMSATSNVSNSKSGNPALV